MVAVVDICDNLSATSVARYWTSRNSWDTREVVDKPELLWDHPELELLHARLESEYELGERAAMLDRKLELTARTVRTILELLQNRRTLRVEWYIVMLIVVEIGLSLYEMFVR